MCQWKSCCCPIIRPVDLKKNPFLILCKRHTHFPRLCSRGSAFDTSSCLIQSKASSCFGQCAAHGTMAMLSSTLKIQTVASSVSQICAGLSNSETSSDFGFYLAGKAAAKVETTNPAAPVRPWCPWTPARVTLKSPRAFAGSLFGDGLSWHFVDLLHQSPKKHTQKIGTEPLSLSEGFSTRK